MERSMYDSCLALGLVDTVIARQDDAWFRARRMQNHSRQGFSPQSPPDRPSSHTFHHHPSTRPHREEAEARCAHQDQFGIEIVVAGSCMAASSPVHRATIPHATPAAPASR